MLTILTSCRNRSAYLPRVWASLQAQGCRRFEWIVGDDGSDDDVAAVVEEYAGRSDFPVTLVQAKAHVGKSRIDNAMVQAARGDITLFCDSDDWLADDAVEAILAAWRPGQSGVTALAATEKGVIADPFHPGETEVAWADLADRHGTGGSDMVYATRTDLLKANPFPEVDLLIPESAVWLTIGDRPTAVVRKVVKFVEYLPTGISNKRVMSYNRGRAHAAAITQSLSTRLAGWRKIVNFQRWAIHGEIGMSQARRMWRGDRVLYRAMTPVAWALAARDRRQGKVVPSHHIFLANREIPISVRHFGLHAR